MTRMYPVFTDGTKFIHSEEPSPVLSPVNCRFAFFTELNLNGWNKIKHKYTSEQAKEIFERWEREKE